jgi:hypothetical protein
MEPLTFQHIHINRAQVLDYVGKLGDLAMNLGKAIKPMRERKLSTFERQNYADQAMRLRYGDRVVSWPVTPAKLLEARRPTDLAKDLWTTFNVVQENVIKGGQFDHDRLDPNGRGYSATRPIVSIDRSQSLNAGLWDITSKFLNN